MIIAVDIGNTNIVVGGIEADHVLFTERLSTRTDKTELEYAIDFKLILNFTLFLTHRWKAALSHLLFLLYRIL